MSLASKGLSALMTPAPQKDIIKNKSRLEHGARINNHNPRVDERDVTVEFHISADNEADFFDKYARLCAVLEQGNLIINTSYQAGVYYKMQYVSCSQFAEYLFGIAKFTLRLTEPNPKDRSL